MSRDLDEVRRAFTAWFVHAHRSAGPVEVDLQPFTSGGYSNEVFFVTVEPTGPGDGPPQRLVLRLPPDGPSLFPSYDLGMQVAVQEAVAARGVPVPAPLTLEADTDWLGAPFLVMPLVAGRCPGELPALDEWVAAATPAQQRTMHEGFLDALARIHRTPWSGRSIAGSLRGAGATLLDELAWWDDLVAWTFDGSPPDALLEVFAWCRAHVPANEPPASVLWGDVRLGNVVFDDHFAPAAVLDWEMASIGPAELDVGWYTALEAMAEHFVGVRAPGFLTRDEIVARHEQALGRPLVGMRWFEVFAMCRSAALNVRTDRLGSRRLGKPPRPVERNGVLRYTRDAIGLG